MTPGACKRRLLCWLLLRVARVRSGFALLVYFLCVLVYG